MKWWETRKRKVQKESPRERWLPWKLAVAPPPLPGYKQERAREKKRCLQAPPPSGLAGLAEPLSNLARGCLQTHVFSYRQVRAIDVGTEIHNEVIAYTWVAEIVSLYGY